MSETVKLLPCPFCGGEPDVDVRSLGRIAVFCEDCGVQPPMGNTTEQASEIWNRRAASPPGVATATRYVEGTWPERCEQRAFVDGAKWWEFASTGGTMWPADRNKSEAEAVRRYGEPAASRVSGPTDEEAKLVAFFRSPDGAALGRQGDHDNLSPAETAIRAMRSRVSGERATVTEEAARFLAGYLEFTGCEDEEHAAKVRDLISRLRSPATRPENEDTAPTCAKCGEKETPVTFYCMACIRDAAHSTSEAGNA